LLNETPLGKIKENEMKRYTILLTLLFALINTGCEDAKAESKDYDVEIAELQQQVSQLNSRLDSTMSVMPTRKIYEGVVGSDNIVSIDIPEIQLTDMPIVSIIVKNYKESVQVGPIDHWRTSGTMTIEDGRIYQDFNWTNTPNVMVGRKFVVSIIK
jgi:hypothetical protein